MKQLSYILREKDQFVIKSSGRSMLPIFREGDILFFKKMPFKNITVNDIILFSKNHKFYTHRIIYRNGNYLVAKGDNNILNDGKVYAPQVLGLVYQIKRKNKIIRLADLYLLQSAFYFQEIMKIKNRLEKEKVSFVFLKGLPVHLYYEGKHPRRIYADCDLLVDLRDYQRAERVLTDNGYAKAKTAFSPVHKILKDKPTEISFHNKVNDFPIIFDVHLEPVFLMNQLGRLEALYPQKMLDDLTAKFLKEKRTISILNEKFSILSKENLILYLALHFFHHNFRGAYRLELIDRVIKSLRNTPGVFIRAAETIRAYKLQNFVYPVFLMLKKYYRTPLPRGFFKLTKADGNKKIYVKKNILRTNIFNDETRLEAGKNRFRNIFFLSAEPAFKKTLIFTRPAVLYSLLYLALTKVRTGRLFSSLLILLCSV